MLDINSPKELVNELNRTSIGRSKELRAATDCRINFPITIPNDIDFYFNDKKPLRHISFVRCDFNEILELGSYNYQLTFKDCNFIGPLIAENAKFEDKIRFRKCELSAVNFRNTTFDQLADFWHCLFKKPITFYKTEFNSTIVFSAATFLKNVLFTYTLFGGKAIFGRTKFEKGIDFSQCIIAGKLQLFDLKFDLKKYEAEYVGDDNVKFQEYVETENKIPLVNKVTTFQILKNQFSKQGNHIDEVSMRKEEKKAFSQLTKSRKSDISWKESTVADTLILCLNRWSNNYRSDFRNGIIFTGSIALFFLLLTLISTAEFWKQFCFTCGIDLNKIGYSSKLFFTFLNPLHSMDYIDGLNPIWGIPYLFDFLGRIAVGYGIYQTVQAFRKFR